MDHLQRLSKHMRRHLGWVVLLENVVLLGWVGFGGFFAGFPWYLTLGVAVALALAGIVVVTLTISNLFIQPIRSLWQAVLHTSPEANDAPAPDIEKVRFGRELVASLTSQIYQIATMAEHSEAVAVQKSKDLHANFIASSLPLPFIVLDSQQNILFANELAGTYIGIPANEMVGKNVYMVLDMSFPSEDTFDKWLKAVKTNAVTATQSWERVRMNVLDNHPTLLFDLAAYYNKGNPDGIETMLVLFDHTKRYQQDDQAVSFIALSVHELRTPLTLLRGYIEAFEEELSDKLDPQMKDFMFKMSASAQQLTAFVNNILNVARVDDDQLELQLHEEDWPTIIKSAANAMALRAKVRGITLEYSIAPGLPPVGIDRVSIHEVIYNLVDNAIKYSGQSKRIRISTYLTKDGLVETTVQDWGVGIPSTIMPHLFTKFYRDHHNRAQIGGTGLGLYLSKAIITAHGGNIWVRSKLGEGSIFGFTLVPYAKLAAEVKDSDNKEMVRGAHGWIKNHSLYRR
ncbi:MAG TPA: ATP-binding protein [Candidatus Saccharimonadales bacterium]|nr:ATP-binding protein [Candidatus Saccharimonadales bacterium]